MKHLKKIFSLLMIVAMMATLLAGCSKTEDSVSESKVPASDSSSSSTETTAPAEGYEPTPKS